VALKCQNQTSLALDEIIKDSQKLIPSLEILLHRLKSDDGLDTVKSICNSNRTLVTKKAVLNSFRALSAQ
jgi:hypothetical protein